MRAFLILILVIICLAGCSRQSGDISYSKQIQPLFEQRCVRCHGTESPRGKIVLTSYEAFSKSRAVSGGGPIAIPGHPEDSRVFIVCASSQPHFRMPPDSAGLTPLSGAEVGLLSRWILQGAKNN